MNAWRIDRRWMVALGASLALGSAALADRPCPPDIDCSGAVGGEDIVAVILAWGTGGGPEDVDGSGTVGGEDLVQVILGWGSCLFDYGPPLKDAEAEQIGLEMAGPNGPLLVPAPNYERIDRDLDLIRESFPLLVPETHTPAWAPNALIVALFQGMPRDEYDCLNVYYGMINENFLFDIAGVDYYVITFSGNLNVEALAQVYSAAPEVSFAEPDGLIGGQNFWVPTRLPGGIWRWDIDDGFHDCFDGCDCHRLYVIETDVAGNVVLISFQEIGQPWCDFGT